MSTEDKQIVRLENLEQFRSLLSTYQPNQATLDLLSKTPLVLLVGPTAAGRNTLINILVQTTRYHYLVSDTTRPPRTNNGILEQDGVEYWFKSEEEFLQGLQDGTYLEAAVIHNQQVSGISSSGLSKAAQGGKTVIDEIEPNGAEHLHRFTPDKLFIFLLPPTFEIWMQRLRKRGEIPEEEVLRRLKSAQFEIAAALSVDYYHFVINNEVHEAAIAVDELANGRQPDPDKQALGRDHAKKLQIEVRSYLEAIV